MDDANEPFLDAPVVDIHSSHEFNKILSDSKLTSQTVTELRGCCEGCANSTNP
jgi:hypothetical protein